MRETIRRFKWKLNFLLYIEEYRRTSRKKNKLINYLYCSVFYSLNACTHTLHFPFFLIIRYAIMKKFMLYNSFVEVNKKKIVEIFIFLQKL